MRRTLLRLHQLQEHHGGAQDFGDEGDPNVTYSTVTMSAPSQPSSQLK
ncbi:hypothetical protein D4764_0287250 [Takifugu flavidus]|uniref:Uncharacterized protein n=1 Tax=Takifugu flavidus TaxID=433684 RepID=A0A5C6MLN8_9TELE|nr:hypothetical protein D4764_0287250 [Takifugu flavidus]